MQIKFTSINVNSFNKSDNKLAHFITHNNIHFTCIQETHTIHHQKLSHFAHQHNFLVFPNTDLSLTPNNITQTRNRRYSKYKPNTS